MFGVNSIATYVLAWILGDILGAWKIGSGDQAVSVKDWFYSELLQSWLSDMNASLAYALCYMLLCLLIMSVFYRNRIFFKI